MNMSQAVYCPESASMQQQRWMALLQVMLASLFLACCAQIKIPLFFSPIPLSCQTLGVMLIGATLGSRKGALSVLAYLFVGSLNLPVFVGHPLGIAYVFGPTGGYLAGFVVQAFLVGWFFERQRNSEPLKTMGVLLLSCLIQMSLGAIWLVQFVGMQNVLMMGLIPFIPGEIVKATAALSLMKLKGMR